LRQNVSSKHRKELAYKIGKALKQETRALPIDMQKILADDLVTAFFSRLEVLSQVKNCQTNADLTIHVSNETIEVAQGRPRLI